MGDVTEIEFDFPVLGRLVDDYIAEHCDVPKPNSPDPLTDLRTALATPYPGGVERIRITEIVPPGMTILAPFERDGEAPGPARRVTDGGPQELLVHPDDWEAMVKPFREEIERRESQSWLPVDWRLRREDISGWQVFGIPVKDDTIKARVDA